MARPRITFVPRTRIKPYRPKYHWPPEFLAALDKTARNGQAVEYATPDPTMTGVRITQSLFNRYLRRGLRLHVRTYERTAEFSRFLVWCEPLERD